MQDGMENGGVLNAKQKEPQQKKGGDYMHWRKSEQAMVSEQAKPSKRRWMTRACRWNAKPTTSTLEGACRLE